VRKVALPVNFYDYVTFLIAVARELAHTYFWAWRGPVEKARPRYVANNLYEACMRYFHAGSLCSVPPNVNMTEARLT
jgi:hypothetical protein